MRLRAVARGLCGASLSALVACGANSSNVAPHAALPAASAAPAQASAAAVSARPVPSPLASASAPPPSASASGLVLGPPPLGTPPNEREATVARLLQGHDAAKLPERALDPESEFEPDAESGILWRSRPEPGMRRGPTVRLGDLTVSASLPADVVRRIFRQNLSRMRQCYEQRLATKPKLAGTVTFSFVITREGELKSPRVSARTLNDAALFECLVRSSSDTNFPQPDASAAVSVSVPISFVP